MTNDTTTTETTTPHVQRSPPSRQSRQCPNSSGPKTAEGKSRSSLNATRHGLLAQTRHPRRRHDRLPRITAAYVKDLSPVGVVETQLAHSCADLQLRLNRIAAEHNLFSIGHAEHGDLWETGHSDSHTALAFAETIRNSRDPLQNSLALRAAHLPALHSNPDTAP